MRRLTNKRELCSAGLMMLIGIGTVIGSLGYDIDSLEHMGPGYFPLMLGIGLIVVSALMIATPLTAEDETAEFRTPAFRPWFFVTAGVIAFITLGKYGGLVPATFTLIFLSAFGDRTNSVKEAFALAVVMTIVAVVVFHYAMQMQFPLFTWV